MYSIAMHIQLTAKDLAAIRELIVTALVEVDKNRAQGVTHVRHFIAWNPISVRFIYTRTCNGLLPAALALFEVKRDGKAVPLIGSLCQIPGTKDDIYSWTAKVNAINKPTAEQAARLRVLCTAGTPQGWSGDADAYLVEVGLAKLTLDNFVLPTARGYTWCAENVA